MGPFERVATYLSLVLLFPPSFLLRLDRLPFHTKMNSAESDKQHPESSPASEASELSPATTPSQEGDSVTPQKRSGRRKINIEFIEDKSRRHITFSKRKAGIMKKAYELSTLTGTQVLLLVASETGHVYTFATPKLQPLITKPEGKNLIQACLNAPETLQESSSPQQPESSISPTPTYETHNPQQIPAASHVYQDQRPYGEDEKLSSYHPQHMHHHPHTHPSVTQDIKPFAQHHAEAYGEQPSYGYASHAHLANPIRLSGYEHAGAPGQVGGYAQSY